MEGDLRGHAARDSTHSPSQGRSQPILDIFAPRAVVMKLLVSFGTLTFSNPPPGPTEGHCDLLARATGACHHVPGWGHVNLPVSNHRMLTVAISQIHPNIMLSALGLSWEEGHLRTLFVQRHLLCPSISMCGFSFSFFIF